MKLSLLNFALLVSLPALLLTSCTKDNKEQDVLRYDKGILITNEGPFTSGTGTITYFNPARNEVMQDIYETVNGKPLGNIVQSLSFFNGKGYIVVNNAAKVEVVDAATFSSTGTISGLTLPRYFVGIDSTKAYVSDWAGVVDVVDLKTNTLRSTIPAGDGPELMMKSGKYVLVLNAGGYGIDNRITVINSETDQAEATIKVFDRPTGIVKDAAGKLWVICSGKGFNGYPAADDTEAHLLQIDPSTWNVADAYDFGSTSDHPEKLVINKAGNTLYFLYKNGIYRYSTTIADAEPYMLVSHSGLYALAFDQANDYLCVTDPLDYQQDGWMIRYKATDGSAVDSIRTGIIPGNVIIDN